MIPHSTQIQMVMDMETINRAITQINSLKRKFNVPVSAYSVSGEYALVKGAAMQGWVDEDAMTKEILYSIKRAGADMIVTYFAKSVASGL